MGGVKLVVYDTKRTPAVLLVSYMTNYLNA